MSLGLSIAILMPPSGAVVFAVLLGLFYFRLILGEEASSPGRSAKRIWNTAGGCRGLYRACVPGFAKSPAQPQWLTSLVAEFLPVSYPLCLAVLAWRYDPLLLVRCLLICFGLSLVMRAFLPKKQAAAA